MTKPIITQETLKRHLHYNGVTGVFTRIKNNKPSGSIDNRGYVRLFVNGAEYQAHRLAWLYVYGEMPVSQIDHKNHVRDDNRIVNLAASTHKENGRNQKRHITNTSGLSGVGFVKPNNKWKACIRVGDITRHLGTYIEWWDAVCARKSANVKIGFHHNHGQ